MFSEDFKKNMMLEFRTMIREEMEATLQGTYVQIQQLPPFLTKEELKKLLRIADTKASALLARDDFPVLREAGVLVPSHLFIQWIEANTQWIDLNTGLAPHSLKALRPIKPYVLT